MNRLIIIGNGFDLHHELPTSYNNFRNFLEDGEAWGNIKMPRIGDLLYLLDSYFYFNHNWSDFEEKLASFDIQSFVDEEGIALVESDDDEHPMRNQAIMEDSCSDKLKSLIEDLPKEINNWICSLSYNIDSELLVNCFDNQDDFISFNYSSTLEKVYEINPSQIAYLHGKASIPYQIEQIVIGHGTKHVEIPDYNTHTKSLNDIFASDIYEESKYIYKELYKNPSKHIPKLQNIEKNAYYYNEVIILGHSLGKVDQEYFTYISNIIRKNIPIRIYYHDKNKLSEMINYANTYFSPHKIQFTEW